jgi:hypothetical protein
MDTKSIYINKLGVIKKKQTMYLTNVTIDIITEDKKLRTISIFPKRTNERVIIEHVQNLNSSDNNTGFGTIQIFNKEDCKIKVNELELATIQDNGTKLTFSTEHMGLPLGQPNGYPTGIYNFILPTNYFLHDLHIVDPYDKKDKDIDKKHFQYEIFWDKKQKRQVVRMYLRSARYDTFSFKIFGSASKEKPTNQSLKVEEADNIIANIADTAYEISFGQRAKKIIKTICEYLELKPNISGLGVNLNKIIDDKLDD